MMFNLLTTPWLEVRRTSGLRGRLRPADITSRFADDPVTALDFARPDWNAAVTEFLIGLMFAAFAPADETEWAERFHQPPEPDELQARLLPLAPYFDFCGDGPRAFQDLDPLGGAEVKPLSSLLIDAPGENAERNNSDLFIKRSGSARLTLAEAAAALITLQTYAPAGGAGHRTSLRGGGPLTTLLAPLRRGRRSVSLWDRVWANVPDGDPEQALDPALSFPWLRPTLTSGKDGLPIRPEGKPAALAFFACPRRIRLVYEGDEAVGYRTLNYGANYLGWRHPLSPYRQDKAAGLLPIHPHAGASDYGDWPAWWGFNGHPATPLDLWRKRRSEIEPDVERTLVEAFGFDMDNMKARQWLDARLPWVPAHEGGLKHAVSLCIGAADAAARALRMAVKLAVYGQRKDAGYRLPETLPADCLPEPAERLWRETQADFEVLLGRLSDRLRDGDVQTGDLLIGWRDRLRGHAWRIFDEAVDLDGLTDQEPRRLLFARGQLAFAFADHPKAAVSAALDLDFALAARTAKRVKEKSP